LDQGAGSVSFPVFWIAKQNDELPLFITYLHTLVINIADSLSVKGLGYWRSNIYYTMYLKLPKSYGFMELSY